MSSGGNKQGLYPLWKYVDHVKGSKGSGGTATISCKLCPMSWQGTYTRVRAHFLHLPGKGVDPCINEVERYEAVRDQERVDGKVSNMSSHASTNTAANQNQNINREAEVDVSSRDVAAESSHKRPHIGSSNPIGRLFDVQG